jgi:Ca2+-binding RTX toxin-like protein
VTQLDIEYTGGGYDLGVGNVSYIPSPTGGATEPILVDYTLTDTDNQSDSAQLAIYTIDNEITGTVGADSITGGALNDAIIGDTGDDILAGGDGHDSISGGAGIDQISGDAGNDYLSGGDDNDILAGGAGRDHVDGDAGDDIVDGGLGDDIVQGGVGDDLVFGGAGDDLVDGEAGDDMIYGGAGNDILFGGEGQDLLIGGQGDDIFSTGIGADTIKLSLGDEGTPGTPAVDTVTDFKIGINGDILDLGDLLQGEESNPLTDYLQFSLGDFDGDGSTDDTRISIDHDAGGLFETTQEIVVNDVDMTAGGTLTDQDIINNLLSSNNLTTD